jgi:hypothetical protein
MVSPHKKLRLTNQFLVLAGELLYGHYWQSRLYVDLGISRRTLAYYRSGEHSVPMNVIHDIIDLLRKRHIDIMNALPSSTDDSVIFDHLYAILEGNVEIRPSTVTFPSVLFIKNYIAPKSAVRQMKLEKVSPEKVTRFIAIDRAEKPDFPFAEWAHSLTYNSYFRRHVTSDEWVGRILYFAISIDTPETGYLSLFEENRMTPSMTFDLRRVDSTVGNWPYLKDFSWLS